jgi:hypothetical protein
MKKTLRITLLAFLVSFSMYAQNLDSLMNAETVAAPDYATATFKASRIINGHSVEQVKQNNLDFRIHHRFGTVNSGAQNFWGLDQANMYLSLEYGLTDWMMLGLGRSNYQKSFNFFGKFKLLRQSSGVKNMPVTVSLFTSADMFTMTRKDLTQNFSNNSRLSYVNQLLIARKFSQAFSLQIMPTYIHQNLVVASTDKNAIFGLGIGSRLKLTKRTSFNVEYYYANRSTISAINNKYNSLSVGFDLETGGHVFQIMLTNNSTMIERSFIGGQSGLWNKGDLMLGFNVSRVFSFE